MGDGKIKKRGTPPILAEPPIETPRPRRGYEFSIFARRIPNFEYIIKYRFTIAKSSPAGSTGFIALMNLDNGRLSANEQPGTPSTPRRW